MLLLAATGALSEDASLSPGQRVIYATRLIGALVVATLVPLLIDRRLRR